MDIYIIRVGQEQEGPFSPEQINSFILENSLKPYALAWYEGLSEWVMVKDIPKKILQPPKLIEVTMPQKNTSDFSSIPANDQKDEKLNYNSNEFAEKKSVDSNIVNGLLDIRNILILLGLVVIVSLGGYIFLNQQAQEKKRLADEAAAKAQEIANQKPKISEIFKTQIIQFIQNGGELSSKVSTGITEDKLSDLTSNLKSSLDLLEMSWPQNFTPDAKVFFEESIKGYILALNLWGYGDREIRKGSDTFKIYSDFMGDNIYIKHYQGNQYYEPYDYMGNDVNIKILFTKASDSFKKGRIMVMSELNN